MNVLNKISVFVLLFSLSVCLQAQKPTINSTDKEWVMTFEDNFDGNDLDWNIWTSDDSKYLKNETHRDKYCVKVLDSELRLYVKKESHNGSKWRAASIFMSEVLENNSYVECRFKSTQCTGVNNAFWLANKTSQPEVYKNRYEIDIVEARQNVKTGKGSGHVAWHDWKTFAYTMNEKGQKFDIAQGASIDHDFAEYHTWGLWYGENDIIIYLDGEPVWNGKTSKLYPDQWWTGVGKAKVWNPVEEKRAYGNFGQDDWSYHAGYNGDKQNVMLSTLPWGETFTPLTDEADGKYMAVDYVRIFKPKSQINEVPVESFDKVGKAVLLQKEYSLAKDTTIYFSVIAEKTSDQPLAFNFVDVNGAKAFTIAIDQDSELLISMNDRTSSTRSAYPATENKRTILRTGGKYLLTGRITAHAGKDKYDRDAVSFSVFDMDELPVKKEPYFYPNIDASGNTSIINEWQINVKDYSEAVIRSVQIAGNWNLSDFKTGYNYLSVLPAKWHGAIAQVNGCEMVKPGTNCSFCVGFSGKSPYTLIYSENGVQKEIKGINEDKYTLEIQPKENTVIQLTDVKDADGKEGSIFGSASAVMDNKKQSMILPVFDTYVQKGKDTDFSNYRFFEMKGDRSYEREIFISFDLSQAALYAGQKALFFIYCSENEKQKPFTMDVLSIETDKSPLIAHFSDYDSSQLNRIGCIRVPAKVENYVGCDISRIVAEYQKQGRRNLILKLKFASGDETNMAKFMQGHGQTSEKGPKIVFIK